MSLASVHVAAVWLPAADGDRRLITVAIETEDEALPVIQLTEETAAALIQKLCAGIGALNKLPGGGV